MDFQLDFYESGDYNTKWSQVQNTITYNYDTSLDGGYMGISYTPYRYFADSYEIVKPSSSATGIPPSLSNYTLRLKNLTKIGGSKAPKNGYAYISWGTDLGDTVNAIELSPTTAGQSSGTGYYPYGKLSYLQKGWSIGIELTNNNQMYKPCLIGPDGTWYADKINLVNIDRTLLTSSVYDAYPADSWVDPYYYFRYQNPTSFIINKTALVNGVDYEQVASETNRLAKVNLAYSKISCNCFLESWMNVRGKKCKLGMIPNGSNSVIQLGVYTIVNAEYNNRTHYYTLLGYDDMYKLQESASNWAKYYSETYGLYEHYKLNSFSSNSTTNLSIASNYIIRYNSDGKIYYDFDDNGYLYLVEPSLSITITGTMTQNDLDTLNNTLVGSDFAFVLDPYGLISESTYVFYGVTSFTDGHLPWVNINGGYSCRMSTYNTSRRPYFNKSELTRYRDYESSDTTLNGHILKTRNTDTSGYSIYYNKTINIKNALQTETTCGAVLKSITDYLGLTLVYSDYQNLGGNIKYTYTSPLDVGTFADVITNVFAGWTYPVTMWARYDGNILLGRYGAYYRTSQALYTVVESTFDNTQYVSLVRSENPFTTQNNIDSVKMKCDDINDYVVYNNPLYLENGVVITVDSPWINGYNQAALESLARNIYDSYTSQYIKFQSSYKASLKILDYSGITNKPEIFGLITIQDECKFFVLEKRINASGITIACNINLDDNNI